MDKFTPSLIPFSGERVEWVIDQSYPTTLRRLRSILHKPSLLKILFFLRLKDVTGLKTYLNRTAGDLGLMILGRVPHGRILGVFGGPHQAQMFLIGNPLTALTMMRVHPEAGVYAPLRVMVSVSDLNKTIVTYDRPSKVFAQWSEPVFDETGKMLDEKMEALIRELEFTP